jgi:8-oxo-dGTP diphosphatase
VTELAGCIFLNSAGELLLLHRVTPQLTQWEIPGGKIEPGETPGHAAVREVAEELGVQAEIIRRLGDATFSHDGRDWHYTWWLARITQGTPEPHEAIFDAAAYFSWPAMAARHDLSPNVQNFLSHFPSGLPR